jgi:hypothetical protein
MDVTPGLKAAVAAALVATVGLLAYGLWPDPQPVVSEGGYKVVIPQPTGELPAGAQGLQVEGYSDETPRGRLRLDAGVGYKYALLKACVVPLDGGTADPPTGIIKVGASRTFSCTAESPLFEIWVQGASNIPWDCACSSGDECFEVAEGGGQTPARVGLTFPLGRWTGPGCVHKPCTEISGHSTWPSGCPQ